MEEPLKNLVYLLSYVSTAELSSVLVSSSKFSFSSTSKFLNIQNIKLYVSYIFSITQGV